MDMERVWAVIFKVACAVGGFILGLLGGWDAPLRTLVFLMGVDYAAGLLVASKGKSPKTENGGLSSEASYHGLRKKLMVMLLLMMAVLLDYMVGVNAFRIAVVYFYAANEGLSILENAALLGLPLPPSLKKALENLKKKKIDIGEDDLDD